MPVTVYVIPKPVAGAVTLIVPVAVLHVGCIDTLAVGDEGVIGWALITAFAEDGEEHPATEATVNVYVFAVKLENVPVVVGPVPVIVVPPGATVTVQVPAAGRPLKSTLPVEIEHVG